MSVRVCGDVHSFSQHFARLSLSHSMCVCVYSIRFAVLTYRHDIPLTYPFICQSVRFALFVIRILATFQTEKENRARFTVIHTHKFDRRKQIRSCFGFFFFFLNLNRNAMNSLSKVM